MIKRETYLKVNFKDGTEYTDDKSSVVAWTAPYKGGRTLGIAWTGKRNKPDFFLAFKTNDQAVTYIMDHMKRAAIFEAGKRERAAERRAANAKPHTLKVGDVLYSSWGYDQTNIDFYEVVDTTDKSVKLWQMAQDTVETGMMSGHTTPVTGEYKRYKGAVSNWKRVTGNNSVKVRSFGAYAYPYDGKAKSCSWYH